VNGDLFEEVNNIIREIRRVLSFRVHVFPTNFTILLHEIMAEKLHYHKVCAIWVPKMLTDEQVFIQKGIEHIQTCR